MKLVTDPKILEQLNAKPDYSNPAVKDAALLDAFEPQATPVTDPAILNILNSQSNQQPKTALGALPQTSANNAYGINPLSPEQSAIGAARKLRIILSVLVMIYRKQGKILLEYLEILVAKTLLALPCN